jgi:hypothetical protein
MSNQNSERGSSPMLKKHDDGPLPNEIEDEILGNTRLEHKMKLILGSKSTFIGYSIVDFKELQDSVKFGLYNPCLLDQDAFQDMQKSFLYEGMHRYINPVRVVLPKDQLKNADNLMDTNKLDVGVHAVFVDPRAELQCIAGQHCLHTLWDVIQTFCDCIKDLKSSLFELKGQEQEKVKGKLAQVEESYKSIGFWTVEFYDSGTYLILLQMSY